MPNYKIDIIIPVYNEKENFTNCYNLIKNKIQSDWRVLVVYDFPEDTTLEAVRTVSKDDPRVKTVLNFERGVLSALKAGFKNAEAEAVLVTMVDDPPAIFEKVDQMVADFYEKNAAVVAASRYMKNGGHHGGPVLKGLLSRLAGLSLYYLIKLPIHDATYNTKIYRKSFIEKTNIESKKGFEVALELTIKAHLASEKVTEVPVIWTERVIGKSRFKLLKWLPAYLHWYWYGLKNYWLS